jgi:DNA-binding response OmpR family regulator
MGKILIIDDDLDILASLQSLLSLNNYQVDITSRWHDVFEKINTFQPNLIILDVFLSGIDGRNICKQLKTETATRHIPVIMFSANEAVADHIFAYGADDFLSKPIELPQLFDKLKRWIKTPELK